MRPGQYGYWIRADGVIVPVGFDGDHYPKVIDHFGDVAPREYATAMEAGWIRLVTDDDFCADTWGDATSARAARTCIRMAADRPIARFVHCDERLHINERFQHHADFARSVSAAIRRRRPDSKGEQHAGTR